MKKIEPAKKIVGEITLPGDKSISHRAIMLGAIANGSTRARRVLDCDDCNYTIHAFRDMGVSIQRDGDYTIIEGRGLRGLKRPKSAINVGNSGTSMRLLSGILAGQDFEVTICGDKSLQKRPMDRIVRPLSLMGVRITAAEGGYPPIKIKGGHVKSVNYKMPVPSAQVKSAVLFAGLYADGVTTLEESFKSRDHTERMLKYFGSNLKVEGLKIQVEGGKELEAKTIEIPADISSASFFMAGAILLKGSRVRIRDVSINPTRAGILDVLTRMGAKLKVTNRRDLFEPLGDIEIDSGETKGIVIDEGMIPGVIDELPIIFVLASLSSGRTVIKAAEELKIKETDRIKSMEENLKAMGAKIETKEGCIIIDGVRELKGVRLKSFGDHRTCMAMTIAALTSERPSSIDDTECVNKSFPEFFKVLESLTA